MFHMRKLLHLKKMLFLISFIAFAGIAFAQKTITGRVSNEKGDPVPFASVKLKGTKLGTSADENGQFRIQARPGDVLQITSSGVEPKEISVGDDAVIFITMNSKANTQLNEIIVTALGVRRQPRELGVSTATIKADELTQAKITNLATGLSAKVAGLQVNLVNNGINPDVRIVSRGNHSLQGNNQVLIVVDGIPVSSSFLNSINPNDVENVTLLKGPGASALYGIEAANGVMQVTTKKGKKGAKPIIKFTSTTQLETISYFPKIQTKYSPNGGETSGFFDPVTGAPVNYSDPFTGKLLPVPFENQSFGSAYNSLDYPYDKIAIGGPVNGGLIYGAFEGNKKNRTNFFQTGVTTQNDVSYSSGDERGSFFISLQDVKVKGIVPKDENRRTGGRFSASKENGKFSAAFNVGFSQRSINTYGNEFAQGRPLFYNIVNQPAHLDLSKFRDVDTNPYAEASGFINAYYPNPSWQIKHARNKRQVNDLISSFQLGLQATNWLNFTYRLGYSQSTINGQAYTDQVKFTQEAISDPWGAGNNASGLITVPPSYENKKLAIADINSDFLININKEFKDFSAKIILGNNIRVRNNSIAGFSNANLAIPGLNNINNRQGDPGLYDLKFTRHDMGFFGDAVIGYKNYLFAHGSYRKDVTSILDEDNRSFGYYSIDGSFVLTDAIDVLSQIKKLSFAKIRVSYSETGNASIVTNVGVGAIDPFVFSNLGAYRLDNILGVAAGFPFGSLVGYTQGNAVVQKGLRPERTKAFETGIQLGFLKDKINLELVYFNDITIDQTNNAGITTSTGATNVLLNAGKLGVKGYEADLKLNRIISTKKFSLSVGANYSFTDNKVIELFPGVNELQIANTGVAGGVGATGAGGIGGPGGGVYAIVGQQYPVIKTNDWLRDPQGRVIVDKITGLPSSDPSIKIFGNTNHRHRLGINTNITFGRFSFTAVADYRAGAKIFNIIGPTLDFTGISENSASTRERFVFPNSVYDDGNGKFVTNTNITVNDANANWWASIYRRIGSNYVNNAAFLKLREVSVSYDFPESFLRKTKVIQKASLTLSGRNLLRFVPKTNVWSDPEFSVDSGNGVGRASILETPATRIFGATLNVTF
jgi:TonB-linked SusC/RagA family outer membrane protein